MSKYTEKIEVMEHSSIRITKQGVIYIDPFHISPEKAMHDADMIFITHEHFDHFSPEDIEKVKNENTIIVLPESMNNLRLNTFDTAHILYVEPNKLYTLNISFTTVPAYNKLKPFHPKKNNWVGYILNINGETIYISGDTDATKEALDVHCDVALIPIGGTYTMNAHEAAKFINSINPKAVVPTHYGSIVGNIENAAIFKNLVKPPIECEILLN